MIYRTINLKSEFPTLEKDVFLTSYCPDNSKEIDPHRKRKTVLVLPGGSYQFVSEREGEPVALAFCGNDVNAFLLHYNVGELRAPYPFIEGFAAIAYLRRHSEEFNVDPDCIAVMGFSAGGHFAGSLGAFCRKKEYADYLGCSLRDILVNGVLLAYPVILMENQPSAGTKDNLLRNNPEKIEEYSLEKQVAEDYPPTFLWTTNDDKLVPSFHSLQFALALREKGVEFEFHYYPHGEHGASLATPAVYGPHTDPSVMKDLSYISNWFSHALRFIREIL